MRFSLTNNPHIGVLDEKLKNSDFAIAIEIENGSKRPREYVLNAKLSQIYLRSSI